MGAQWTVFQMITIRRQGSLNTWQNLLDNLTLSWMSGMAEVRIILGGSPFGMNKKGC